MSESDTLIVCSVLAAAAAALPFVTVRLHQLR
jgi:hypothetical protein